ncbi:MAG: DUF1176 domain-containing protein [Rhizobiaceae bacterium]|nr:DUF1176 domain-containing protein [Rhizobiaceae bacterium]
MRIVLAAFLGMATFGNPAFGQDQYVDDRSDPVVLIRSLYNAINRQEYARAWSYFATPPAASLQAYADGYADTAGVELRTGSPSEEGAAGSTHFQLPVAIEAYGTDGAARVFSGCYELRMSNPDIPTDEFTPLQIERGRFSVSDKPLNEAVPASCGSAETRPVDLLQERAVGLYELTLAELCQGGFSSEEMAPESHTIRFRYDYEEATAPERQARLFAFLCNRGAYNESHVYIFANENEELRTLSFAVPELDIRYRDENNPESAVEEIYVIGFRTVPELVNSEYDPDTRTINSWAKWRGLGDASSTGRWLFRNGEFSLVRYDVDASYDGEINEKTVLDYASGP